MNYIVWVTDYGDSYKKVVCGDKPAAERAIFEALKQGQEPILTIEVPYSCNVKMGELKEAEACLSKSKKTVAIVPAPEEGKSEAKES